MNLEGAKKLDPPHLTPLKKGGGGDGGGVFWPFLFFFGEGAGALHFLGSWESES